MKSTNAPELEIEKGYQMNSKQMAKEGRKSISMICYPFGDPWKECFFNENPNEVVESRNYSVVDKRNLSRIGSAFKAETNNTRSVFLTFCILLSPFSIHLPSFCNTILLLIFCNPFPSFCIVPQI